MMFDFFQGTWHYMMFNGYYNQPNHTNLFCYNLTLNGNRSVLYNCQNQIKNLSTPTIYICAKPHTVSPQVLLINGATIDITRFDLIPGSGAISLNPSSKFL